MSLPPPDCSYVTDEFLREWKTAGGNPGPRPPGRVPSLRFLYELCWNMVRGEFPFHKCKPLLDSADFFDNPTADELASAFADIISQMALDLTLQGDSRNRLAKLAKSLVESGLVPLRLFHERCEEEFLSEAELIKIKAQELKNKEVRVNTRLLYQQTKFNLLREESEGYAKLVTILCRGSEASTPNAAAATVGIIKSLIGHFDLDPNRVFDIVLDCFELQPDTNIFLELIPIFPKSHASQILGFKFQYYQRMEVNSPVPFGLYKITALLVKEDFIDLDSVCSHLLPKDDEAFEHYTAFSAKRLDEANKIGKVNLAATGKDLMEDEKQGDVSIDLFAAIDLETDAVTERHPELENNQSLGLLSGFLSVEDWFHANILFERLAPLNPVAHLQIRDGLLRLIEKNITPVYTVVRKMHFHGLETTPASGGDAMEARDSSPYKSFIDLPKTLFQMLTCAGPYLYHNTILLQKVCRVLRVYLQSALDLGASNGGGINVKFVNGESKAPRIHLKEARLRVEEALGTCLLPSLHLVPANPAVGQEIWEVMSLLPYEVRYRLYGEWEKEDEEMPMILAAKQTAKLDTRRILKRLARENLKPLGRMVAKLAHANPMTVLRTIVHQIEAYRNMIAPVVDAFKYLTQLEYDILEYVVIERLAQGGREKLKDDGLNLSDWLLSLASFWGHLCKKYPSMELRGLFQYLVNQLKRGQGIELVVLQELIQQMANVQYTENLTEEQLDAMAGSETLRHLATSFGLTRSNKALVKSTNRLRDSLLPKDDPKLAVPLLLLIAQHRSLVVINTEAPYVKMVSEQFDRCHGALLQYVEFLCSSVTPAFAYAQLIPTLDDLVHQYHLEPEVAFLIYRPVMRIFKCQGGSELCWPLDIKERVNSDPESEDKSRKLVLDLGKPKPIMWSDLLATARTMLPAKAWNSLSPDLYLTFWGLTLYDLYVPRSRYESEIAKQHALLRDAEELSDTSSNAITKRKKDKERIQESLDRLTSELHKHEENVASVRARLSREKDKWLSSCPDTLKINMEFLQRCIFPRCTFSMPDAVYCAMFVNTLHSLGTPFFNTVNHIDVLICKTLQPMICCCTEYEVGRLGKFLYETLKTAYYWKSDESVYERECGNKPGFAVYYRYPNSQRVTFGQFMKVHWKWSQRITKLLIACLESSEYMEIRNALILLTKISGVFPVTRKTGINLEKRVAKIKADEREDLKVLATGVAAAMAARKPFWVTDEEFGMGYLDLKPSTVATKSVAANTNNGTSIAVPLSDSGKVSQKVIDSGISFKEQPSRTKLADGKHEKSDNAHSKSDTVSTKVRGGLVNGSSAQTSATSTVQAGSSQRQMDDSAPKDTADTEVKHSNKQASISAGSLGKPVKQDSVKDDGRSGKTVLRTSASAQNSEGRQSGVNNVSNASTANGGIAKGCSNKPTLDSQNIEPKSESTSKSSDVKAQTAKDDGNDNPSVVKSTGPRREPSPSASKLSEKLQKRSSPADEPDRVSKRRKGDSDSRDTESETQRTSDKERKIEVRLSDSDRIGNDEQSLHRASDRASDRSKDKGIDRHDRDYRERMERDVSTEKSRDKSIERYGRERSVERGKGREEVKDERSKDERSKLRHGESIGDKPYSDERFHGQSLPPPPPLPPHMVPQSVPAGRRENENTDGRLGSARHSQRLSPRHEERERRRSEENAVPLDDTKRRREDDFRDRKREEREALPLKADERDKEREREREKANPSKEDMEIVAAKRRKLKREHLSSAEPGEYSPGGPPPPLSINLSQSYDSRGERDRKGTVAQRPMYMEEQSSRIHGKEMPAKLTRREAEQMYDREWEEEKRQRAEPKRRHRK